VPELEGCHVVVGSHRAAAAADLEGVREILQRATPLVERRRPGRDLRQRCCLLLGGLSRTVSSLGRLVGDGTHVVDHRGGLLQGVGLLIGCFTDLLDADVRLLDIVGDLLEVLDGTLDRLDA